MVKKEKTIGVFRRLFERIRNFITTKIKENQYKQTYEYKKEQLKKIKLESKLLKAKKELLKEREKQPSTYEIVEEYPKQVNKELNKIFGN